MARRASADRRGATLIEFALIAPAFIALLIAIIETALVFFAQQSLETAAEAASRQIMTGATQNAGLTQLDFHTAACGALYSFMSCGNLLVDVQNYSSFSSANTSTPTLTYDPHGNVTTQYAPGSAGGIVVLRLMYIWSLPTGPLGFTVSNLSGNQRLLIATSVAKTEPYGS